MNEKNRAGMAGKIIKAPEALKSLYGRKNLYRAYVEINRLSGTSDTVIIVFPASCIDTEGHENELKFLNPQELLTEGKEILFMGATQTMRNAESGQFDTFILCDYIATGYAEPQNAVKFVGTVEREARYRATPKGKKITDLIIRVPSEFENAFYCLLPVICWGKVAEDFAQLKEGETVEVEGRLQSRAYVKRYEDGSEEQRTATEVSASIINRK